MARRVVSIVRGPGAALRAAEPVLEANAYAIAHDIDLAVVLRGAGVELAVGSGEVLPTTLAGVGLPPAANAQDVRGLIESGVAVHVAATDLDARGLVATDLVDGVTVSGPDELAALLRGVDAVIGW